MKMVVFNENGAGSFTQYYKYNHLQGSFIRNH
jgi:hypothetical protein